MPLRREPARALPVPFWRYIFLVEPADLAAALGLGGAQPQVGLVHHHHVVQQLLVDARRKIGRLDVVLADFGAAAVVNGRLAMARLIVPYLRLGLRPSFGANLVRLR